MHQPSSPIREDEQAGTASDLPSPAPAETANTLLSENTAGRDTTAPENGAPLPAPPSGAHILDENGQFAPEWWNGHESLAELGKTLRKFKSPEALAKSYAELEKMKSYPEAGDEEKMSRFRQFMGLPQNPEEYKLTPPELKEGHELCWDHDLASEISQTAHKYAIPLPALQAVAEVFTQAQEKHFEQERELMEERQREEQESSMDALRQLWGARCSHKIAAASSTLERLSREAGIAPDQLSRDPRIGSNPDFIRLLNHVGELLGDPPLKGADSSQAASAREEALQMERDPGHPLHEAYMNYKHPNHEYANRLYDKAMLKK